MTRPIPVQPRTPMYALQRTGPLRVNSTEATFAEWAKSEGWRVTKRGWPDFLCRRDGELMAVEVKGPKDSLSAEQRQTLSDLRAAGIPAYVWGPDRGLVAVGAPTGESIYSLRATIVDLRRRIIELEALVKPAPPSADVSVVEWTPDLSEPMSIAALARICKRRHAWHALNNEEIEGKPFCVGIVLLAEQGYSTELVAAMVNLSVDRVQRLLDSAKKYVINQQHKALHAEMGIHLRCSGCPNAQSVA